MRPAQGRRRRKGSDAQDGPCSRNLCPSVSLPPDPELEGGRHTVETVFQRITRFRRIALRCGKTRSRFVGFVLIVTARDWRGAVGPHGTDQAVLGETASAVRAVAGAPCGLGRSWQENDGRRRIPCGAPLRNA
jgi:hypothetical protein